MVEEKDIGNPRDWVELPVAEFLFRTRKERTLLAAGIIEKIFSRDRGLGAHDIIKADCEIQDKKTKQWREINNLDLEEVGRHDGSKLIDSINELRAKEKDFHKTKS